MADTPPSSPEQIARRTRSRLSLQDPSSAPPDSLSVTSALSTVSPATSLGSVPSVPTPASTSSSKLASDSSRRRLESSPVSDESQGIDLLQRRLNMVIHRNDAALDTVLLDALSNMHLAKNSALAHALVALGSYTIEDVSWLTVDDVTPSLQIPSLDNVNGTVDLGITHFRGVQFLVFYISETRRTDFAHYQQCESYTHAGFLSIQEQRMRNFETPRMLQKRPDEIGKALTAFQKARHTTAPFPKLTDDLDYTVWLRKFIPTCRVENIYRVIDPDTVVAHIRTQDDKQLFALQSQFMWLVLRDVLQTPSAQSLLNHAVDHSDPRAVWCDYAAYQTTSEHSRLATISMFSRLHAMDITDRKGSRDDFLINFTEQLLIYETRANITLQDHIKFSLLARSVANDPVLNQLTTTVGMSHDLNGQPPTYVYFASKLRQLAANSDQTEQDNKLRKRRDPNSQQVLMHAFQEIGYQGTDDELAAIADSLLSVNAARQTHVDTRLNNDVWNKMSPDDRRSWQRTPRDLKKFLVWLITKE